MSLAQLFRDLEPALSQSIHLLNQNHPSDFYARKANNNLNIAVDAIEDEESFTLIAEVPGLNLEDIKIKYEDELLILSGEKLSENLSEEKDIKIHQQYRKFGKFEKKFNMPENIDFDQIKASLKNGILTIKLPKVELEEKKSREIQISLDS
ncbi:Hsp20/alpha crystallin family protein [bacterium]|nr:Hsp20/alpha crystallin family protein [bacterium]